MRDDCYEFFVVDGLLMFVCNIVIFVILYMWLCFVWNNSVINIKMLIDILLFWI